MQVMRCLSCDVINTLHQQINTVIVIKKTSCFTFEQPFVDDNVTIEHGAPDMLHVHTVK